MKTIVACFLGLIALVTFASGSAVYADALEAGSLPILAPDAGTNGVDSSQDAHCAFYSDGADNCIVNVQPEVNAQPQVNVQPEVNAQPQVNVQPEVNAQPQEVDQWSTAGNELDPAAIAPAVRFVDAIPVTVVQTVTIAASGSDAGDREATSSVQPIPLPATQPKTMTGAIVEPTEQSGDAIVVAVVQSTTVVVPAQGASDQPPTAQLLLPPPPPHSLIETKNDGLR
jgi:hypothetical protein